MNWAEESEKPPSFLTKTENQRLNWRKPANRTRHQNRKTAIFKSENRKTESKLGQIRKTENPNAPLHLPKGYGRSLCLHLLFEFVNDYL